jgi:hypothetical protein
LEVHRTAQLQLLRLADGKKCLGTRHEGQKKEKGK